MPSRRVFVPRHPEIGKTYHDGNSSAFVTGSSTSSTVPTIQVVDSQQIGKSVAMIKLTLRRGVGAIYIDGLNFWNSGGVPGRRNLRFGVDCWPFQQDTCECATAPKYY